MRFEPLKSPNLPTADVKHVVISGQYPEFVSALSKLGVTALLTEQCPDVMPQISYHADIVFSHLGEDKFLIEQNQKSLLSELYRLGFTQADSAVRLGEKYPNDVLLNSCIIGSNIICGKDKVHPLLLNNKTTVKSSQGYAKCSVCVVDESSVITDDSSIFEACQAKDIDALLVSKGSVKLAGFDYGFIGGCSGKLSKDTLLFCGDISTHSDYHRIKSFLSFRGVQALSLSDGPLIDIGSVIPISQIID